MTIKTGVDVRTMTWWRDLVAMVIAINGDFDSVCELIRMIPQNVLLSLDQEGLFQVVETLIGNERSNELFWSAQIARAILYHISISIEDDLLARYDMRLVRKDYSGQPLSWINSLAVQLMQKKQRQIVINAFFRKYF